MTDYYIDGIILILALVLILCLIYFARSNKKSKHVFNQRVNTKESKTYLIKVNYATQMMSFCNRGPNERNEETILTKDISIHDFIESLPLQQQKNFYDFIFDDCVNENVKARIVVNANRVLNLDEHHWLRLNYKEKFSNNITYIKGIQIFKRNVVKTKKEFEHYSVSEFRTKIEELHPTIDAPVGTIFCFVCNKMDNISRHYGDEIANDYVTYMWDEICNIFANHGFVCHFKDDIYLAYYDKLINKRDVISQINYIINEIDFNFEIDTYTFEIKPFIGAIICGEYDSSVTKNIDGVYQAALKIKEESLGRRYRIYDTSLLNEFKQEKEYYEDLKNIMQNSLFDPFYSPIVSLLDGSTFGYFSDMDFSNYSFSSFNEALDKANNSEMGQDFFTKALSKWLTSFLTSGNEDSKLFVFTNFELIDDLIKTYKSREEYRKIKIIVVITNYDDLLKDPFVTKGKIKALRDARLTIGVTASPKLQSVLTQELRYFDYLILPRSLTADIIKDPRKKLIVSSIIDITSSYYMQRIAIDIDNYQEAEVLKELDVSYMSGQLFDTKKSNISMRKLSHLYDEIVY